MDIDLDNKQFIFVYGTLKKGFHFHFHLRNALFVGEGYLSGYAMYRFKDFPIVAPCEQQDACVYGEVYLIENSLIPTLDRVEGSLYIQSKAICHLENDRDIPVMFYEYNGYVKKSPQIKSGKWE